MPTDSAMLAAPNPLTRNARNAARSLLLSFAVMLLALAAAPLWAQLSNTPREATWETNGAVRAIVVNGPTTYIGGDFSYVGPNTGTGVPINTTTGVAIASFPKVNGTVYATVPDGSGGWYIGGAFTQVGTLSRNNIARILAGGTVDPAWNPNANSDVYDLAVSGSTVYAGGGFTSIGGQARNCIAAIDAATGNATAWNPNASSWIRALAVSGSTVYAGGGFTSIGGQARNNIAEIDAATGIATAWNPDANGYVRALAVSGSTVYAGGDFTSIGGQTRNRIAAINAATGAATAWNPNASSWIRALAVSGSTVYAGGDFTSIGGQTRNRIAAIDAATGNATAWNPNSNGEVRTFAISGSTVYAGGYFTSIGGQTRNRIAAIDATTGSPTAWNPSANNWVEALAVSGSAVYAGGSFTSIGGQARSRLAAIDNTTGSVTAWNPDANGRIWALAVSGSTVYAGGGFTSIGGQTRNRIAAIDAATGIPTAWNPNAGAKDVTALAVTSTTVYAGGEFTSVGGQTRNFIAAIDAATGIPTDWNPNANGGVFSLAISGSSVYAGGMFTSLGGQPRNNIAAIDTATGHATDWNPNASGVVGALAISGSTIYAGGGFFSIGGQSRNRIAAIDAATGSASTWNPTVNGDVYALAVSGSTIYAGGGFFGIGDQLRRRLAAIDAVSGTATAWNPDAGNWINALAFAGSTLYVGGGFTTIGGQPRNYFAQFDSLATPEFEVLDGAANVANGGGPVSLGTVDQGDSAPTKTFTVKNTGEANLILSGLSVPSGYSVTEPLSAMIEPSGEDTFTISLSTVLAGTFAGTVQFTSNATDESPFSFTVSGTVMSVPLGVQYSLQRASIPPDGGSIAVVPGPRAGDQYAENTTVQLTAQPASGYTFRGWFGDASGSATTTSVAMTDHKHVFAAYRANGANDAYEPNNDYARAQPVAIKSGNPQDNISTVSGLVLSAGDEDWYRLRLPALTHLRIDAIFSHAQGNIQMQLWDRRSVYQDRSWGQAVGESYTATNDEAITFANLTNPADLYLRVYTEGGTGNPAYVLSFTTTDIDDQYDVTTTNNSACETVPTLALNTTHEDLVLRDEDWYRLTLPNGTTQIDVDISHFFFSGDLNFMVIGDVPADCGGVYSRIITGGYGNDAGQNRERVTNINVSGRTSVLLRVYGANSFMRNQYDLRVDAR